MKILIQVYILIFIIWSILGIREDIKSRYHIWVIFADILMSLIALIGMVLYSLNIIVSEYSHLWKILIPVILGWEIWLGRVDYVDDIKNPDPELSVEENRKTAIWGTCLSIIFFVPCFIILYHLATA